MASREKKIHQYVREKYGEQVAIPSSETLRLVWREWFGPGGSRQRYARSAAVAEAGAAGAHVVIHRPGWPQPGGYGRPAGALCPSGWSRPANRPTP
jgi:hypothetical protein